MQPSNSPSPTHSAAAVAVQLAVSHLAAAVIALWIAPLAGGVIAVIAALMVGVLLTATLQRTLWLAHDALDHLSRGLAIPALSARWHGPLAGLVARIDALSGRDREVYDLRRGLLEQTREAAAQSERNRLARDLHDSIKQQIFSISMSAAAAQARAESDPDGAKASLADVRQSAQEAMVEMTALLQQLSPAPLEKVGLVQALRDQVAALGYRTGAEVLVEIGDLPDDERLPPGAQESLFRIVQEALSNAARHARASHVEVRLGMDSGEGPLMLTVRDDGQGFAAGSGSASGGMGLTNIRQRVAALHGKLSVESAPGEGTSLRVRIPLVLSLDAQENMMELKTDHTWNKMILTGFAGGLLLTAVLYYPLYVLWPGTIVADWPYEGSRGAGLVFQGLAVIVLLATGFAAARWAKPGQRGMGTLFGALAGGMAGLIAYYLAAGPAAGVAGAAPILSYGIRLPQDEAHSMWMMAESVTDSIWWSYGALWAMLLGGLGLGAVGGLVVRPSAVEARALEVRGTAITTAAAVYLTAVMTLIISIAIFASLQDAVVKLIPDMLPHTLKLSPYAISAWAIGTPLIFEALAMIAVFSAYRAARRASDPHEITGGRGVAIFWALGFLAVGIYLLTVGLPVKTLLDFSVLMSAALHLAYGLMFAWNARSAAVVSPARVHRNLKILWQGYVNSMLASLAALLLIPTVLTSAALNLVLLIIPNIPWAASWEGLGMPDYPLMPLPELVQASFLSHTQGMLIGLVFALASYGLVALIIRGLLAVMERRARQQAEILEAAELV